MKKINLDLQERSYEILVGKNSSKEILNFLKGKNYSNIFVITDENINKYYPNYFQKILPNSIQITLPAGEKTKSFEYLQKISEEILGKGIDRKSLIIAFGGGVIGDFSGFLASILLRGIDFVQVPTTLLSTVDSSVGGKTAINSKSGKNLIGSFYQPKLVLCDLNLLQTLPKREILAGFAEVVKYGFIYDKKFFEFLEENYSKLFDFDEEFLTKIITRSCEIKANIVAKDEKEFGLRAILNFGHTFGHIFETEMAYSSKILHGEAVAIGMLMAAKMSQNLSLISKTDYLRIADFIKNSGLEVDLQKIEKFWNKKNLISHLFKDKKVENGNLTFVLLEEIGLAKICKDIKLQEFEKVLLEFCNLK